MKKGWQSGGEWVYCRNVGAMGRARVLRRAHGYIRCVRGYGGIYGVYGVFGYGGIYGVSGYGGIYGVYGHLVVGAGLQDGVLDRGEALGVGTDRT